MIRYVFIPEIYNFEEKFEIEDTSIAKIYEKLKEKNTSGTFLIFYKSNNSVLKRVGIIKVINNKIEFISM